MMNLRFTNYDLRTALEQYCRILVGSSNSGDISFCRLQAGSTLFVIRE